MSALLHEAVASWLAGRASLAVGTAVFCGRLPQDVALATAILPTGGPAQEYVPTVRATFQILTRGTTPQTASTRAWLLYEALHSGAGGTAGSNVALDASWRAVRVEPIQPPADLGVGESGQYQVSFNIAVEAVRIPAA
jgi:hypothetical protein